MKRQFTVITKDGSKWLRPESVAIGGPNLIYTIPNGEDLPYIGTKPEGTTVDESEVMEVRQILYNDVWQQFKRPIPNGNYETRTVYTDAESHGRHVSDEVHPILAWLRTNGEISEDGKHVTYSCEEIEAFFDKPNWMRFKED